MLKFDIPFLEAEFRRAGIPFQNKDQKCVDVQILYHLLEPRDLKSAYLKYCGKEMELAHTAQGDATAAAEILDKQLEIHQNLPKMWRVYMHYVVQNLIIMWIRREVHLVERGDCMQLWEKFRLDSKTTCITNP